MEKHEHKHHLRESHSVVPPHKPHGHHAHESHAHREPSQSDSGQWLKALGVIAVVCVLVLVVYAVSKPSAPGKGGMGSPAKEFKGSKAEIDLYVMSQCPYGVEAENAIIPAAKKLGSAVDLRVHYISTDLGNGMFQSLHGDPETKGNIVQLCAREHAPDKAMDFILCMNENPRGIPDNWKACATRMGIDEAKMEACYMGDQGKQLLSASVVQTQRAGVTGSPTIVINGQVYNGGRKQSDFMRAMCSALSGDIPAECASLPEIKPVNLIILSDARCADCGSGAQNIAAQLNSIFGKVNVRTIDYMTPQGKELYESTGVHFLPALLFDDTVRDGDGYMNVAPYLEPAGAYTNLRIGASFDPTKEICDNGIDDDANGELDCADSYCQGQIVCRPEIERKLDVFVMSQCPYGIQALNAMRDVVSEFDGLKFDVHFIADVYTAEEMQSMPPQAASQCHQKADGLFYCALHGKDEVDENVRELCVKKYYPQEYKYMEYIWCRNKNIRSMAWQSCAQDNGMDVARIESCSTSEEGWNLLANDVKIAKSLGVGASPTWLANNKQLFSGIDAYSIKVNFCRENPQVSGCMEVLASVPPPAATQPAGVACGI